MEGCEKSRKSLEVGKKGKSRPDDLKNRKRTMAADNRLSSERWVMPCGPDSNDTVQPQALSPVKTSVRKS